MKTGRDKSKYQEKTCPNATLSTTNPTCPDLGSNSSRRGGKPASNCLSYGTALTSNLLLFKKEVSIEEVKCLKPSGNYEYIHHLP
jgi:hypothetical protein